LSIFSQNLLIWLILRKIHLKIQLSNSSSISWREQVTFWWNDDEVRFVLDQHAELNFYSASSPKKQSMDRHVDRKHPLKVLYIHLVNKHGSQRNSCFLVGLFLKIFSETACQIMRNFTGRIYRRSSKDILISSQLDKKDGRHGQFVFLNGWNLKNLLWS